MKVKISELIPLRADIYKYSFPTDLLEEYSFSSITVDELRLIEETMRVHPNCNVYHEDISLTFDAHIKYSDSKFSIEIPIFLFQDMTSFIIDGNLINSKNIITITDDSISLCDCNEYCNAVSTFDWDDIITINKTILGKSWQYWVEKGGFEIVFNTMDT